MLPCIAFRKGHILTRLRRRLSRDVSLYWQCGKLDTVVLQRISDAV